VSEPITPCVAKVLDELFNDLDGSIASDRIDEIGDYADFSDDRDNWTSHEEFLKEMSHGVEYDYYHGGDPDDKHLFDKAQQRIGEAIRELERCGDGQAQQIAPQHDLQRRYKAVFDD
jgi:hypothetical protein